MQLPANWHPKLNMKDPFDSCKCVTKKLNVRRKRRTAQTTVVTTSKLSLTCNHLNISEYYLN